MTLQTLIHAGSLELPRLLRFVLIFAGIDCLFSSYLRHQAEKITSPEAAVRSWQRLHGHVLRTHVLSCLAFYLAAYALDKLQLWAVPRQCVCAVADYTRGPTALENILRYAFIGVGAEGCFTMAFDRKPHGYSSVWYLPIYVLIPVWATWSQMLIGSWPVWARGLVHMGMIYLGELFWMSVLRKWNGRSPSQDEYERGKYHFRALIRYDLCYAWLIAGLVFELMVVSQSGRLPNYSWRW